MDLSIAGTGSVTAATSEGSANFHLRSAFFTAIEDGQGEYCDDTGQMRLIWVSVMDRREAAK
jgi:hypothetical protein